ncbi:hypothetical protein F443_06350 [Plasmopara halstedii]|uniref:Uncharacterized protein n=1 Tax=Plasmopara halstedii TaxID=4781 RepID=A0A0P1AKX9_PLAHL|nr:hypothetical protein F443_06350 [Plasmopara halstedii]CEG41512.1 hypothetical protein F443_06350 [Plasmopara halstedii]|eukprot:XP_024577881.1 hypothetical protein F443_06350 [Plasmopara halstedii]
MTRAECVAVWKAARDGDEAKLERILDNTHGTRRTNIINWKHHIYGTTPLMAAVESKYGERIVWQLIAAGADVNATDDTSQKNTALHYAAMTNQNSLMVDALLTSDADAFVINRSGLLPIDLARQNRRDDAAAALLEHMKVHSGWIYMRGRFHWKKRWGVVIACNKQRTSRELCIFRRPGNLRPEAVLLIDESARASSHVSNAKFFWLKRWYAFTFDKPVMWQCVKRQKLTRSPICHKTMSLDDVHIKEIVFAANNFHNLECWQRVLQSDNFYDPETGAPLYGMSPYDAPHGELYYWPHELVQNVRLSIMRQQEAHEGNNEALSERSGLRSENEELLADILRGLDESNEAGGSNQTFVQAPKTVEVAQPPQQPLSNRGDRSYRSGNSFETIHPSSPRFKQRNDEDLALCPKCYSRGRNASAEFDCTPS